PWVSQDLSSRPYPSRAELSDPTFCGGTSRYASGATGALDNSCAAHYWLEPSVVRRQSGHWAAYSGPVWPSVGPLEVTCSRHQARPDCLTVGSARLTRA
ncbi:hypothetical protein C8A03DRAFT_14484, partial [Achaetomium macrosporum]